MFSVRINERKQRDIEECKKLAYLIDLHTISIRKYLLHYMYMCTYTHVHMYTCTCVHVLHLIHCMYKCIFLLVDLTMGITIGTINHETKINWLEVSSH